jgi:hypothetical protein
MKASRILLLVCLGLGLAVVAGCDKDYSIHIMNATGAIQNVRIEDSTGFPERDFSLGADGAKQFTKIKQDENAVESYTIKTNKYTQTFTISKAWNDRTMFFQITPDGIIGPSDKFAEVNAKWEKEKVIKTAPQFKVTGD